MEDEIAMRAARAREYLEGETELGEPDPTEVFGPTHATQKAIRRRAYLNEVQHQAATDCVLALKAAAADGWTSVEAAATSIVDRVMGFSRRVIEAGGLEDMSAESYSAAVRKGCDRLQVGVAETKADGGRETPGAWVNAVERIAVRDMARWHGLMPGEEIEPR